MTRADKIFYGFLFALILVADGVGTASMWGDWTRVSLLLGLSIGLPLLCGAVAYLRS